MGTWDELEQAVTTPSRERRQTSTDAELDAFETERGVKLPGSYREFAKTFGRCQLGRSHYLFAAPEPGGDPDSVTNLAALDEMMRGNAQEEEELVKDNMMPPVAGSEVGMRLVYFASNDRADAYGFDPNEVTDTATVEYAIYSREQDSDRGYVRIASSLPEFVMRFCLGDELAEWRKWVDAGGKTASADDDDDEDDMDPRILLQPM